MANNCARSSKFAFMDSTSPSVACLGAMSALLGGRGRVACCCISSLLMSEDVFALLLMSTDDWLFADTLGVSNIPTDRGMCKNPRARDRRSGPHADRRSAGVADAGTSIALAIRWCDVVPWPPRPIAVSVRPTSNRRPPSLCNLSAAPPSARPPPPAAPYARVASSCRRVMRLCAGCVARGGAALLRLAPAGGLLAVSAVQNSGGRERSTVQ